MRLKLLIFCFHRDFCFLKQAASRKFLPLWIWKQKIITDLSAYFCNFGHRPFIRFHVCSFWRVGRRVYELMKNTEMSVSHEMKVFHNFLQTIFPFFSNCNKNESCNYFSIFLGPKLLSYYLWINNVFVLGGYC